MKISAVRKAFANYVSYFHSGLKCIWIWNSQEWRGSTVEQRKVYLFDDNFYRYWGDIFSNDHHTVPGDVVLTRDSLFLYRETVIYGSSEKYILPT